jgi:nucleoside-specific outer membrane channel protein Tsx
MKTNPDIQALHEQQVREIAKQRLQSAINSLQRAMYDLEVYADKFDNASTDYDRAKVINYAINHLYCNIQPNLRIDLLAGSQAELAKLEVSNA